ncbi:MAG: alpha/beta hydrolase family protein [Candidatus Levyibacteriota bacterium]
MKKVHFKTSDGIRLAGIWHLPSKPTTKAIILAHGLNVDKNEEGIFVDLAKKLATNGFAVFRFDFRSRGESEGNSIDITLETEQCDLLAAVAEVRKARFQTRGLVGASFGGGNTTLFVAQYPESIKALCLWNPILNYDHTLINPTLPWICARNEIRKKELQEQGWTTVGSGNFFMSKKIFDEMSQTFPFEELKKITIPTLILHGTDDTYVPYEDSENYTKNLTHGTFLAIPHGKHGFQYPLEARQHALKETVAFFQKNL